MSYLAAEPGAIDLGQLAVAAIRAELGKARGAGCTVAVTTRSGDRATGKVEALTEVSVTLADRGQSYRLTRLVVLADVFMVEVSW